MIVGRYSYTSNTAKICC